MRSFALLLAGLAAVVHPLLVCSQDGNTPPPKGGGVTVTFLPPPMEGALNLGVYKSGKLVRTLKKEANPDEGFTVGLNGLITSWDGKDDSGSALPAGAYSLHGYCVGAMEVTGEAFYGNDWITDEDSPRLAEIVSIQVRPDDLLLVTGKRANGAPVVVECDAKGQVKKAEALAPPQPPTLEGLPDLSQPIASCAGANRSIWVIDRTPGGVRVKQYSNGKEFLRELAIEPGDPEPVQIAASSAHEVVYLLEKAPGRQIVRGLALESPGEESKEGARQSLWKTFLSKQILASGSYAEIAGKLDRKQPFKPEEKFSVRLLPNPLYQDAATTVEIQAALDQKGSFLRTTDGLFLWRLTETPHLRWVVCGHEGNSKALTVLQSDGAVVEEFRVRRLANMMAFDAGEYELKK